MSVNIRIPSALEEEAEKLYGNKTRGATKAVEGFFEMRKQILLTMEGLFSKLEITGLVATQNGTLLDPALQANKQVFIASVEDGERFENYSTQFGYDFSELKIKLTGLTPGQAYFLQEEIFRFWNFYSNEALEDFFKYLKPYSDEEDEE